MVAAVFVVGCNGLAPGESDALGAGAAISSRCDAQDAAGIGACRASVGIFWDGAACGQLWGCQCSGADCGAGYESFGECESAHSTCPGSACSAQVAEGEGACRGSVGVFWNGAECEHRWGCGCVGADCDSAYATIDECRAARVTCTAP